MKNAQKVELYIHHGDPFSVYPLSSAREHAHGRASTLISLDGSTLHVNALHAISCFRQRVGAFRRPQYAQRNAQPSHRLH